MCARQPAEEEEEELAAGREDRGGCPLLSAVGAAAGAPSKGGLTKAKEKYMRLHDEMLERERRQRLQREAEDEERARAEEEEAGGPGRRCGQGWPTRAARTRRRLERKLRTRLAAWRDSKVYKMSDKNDTQFIEMYPYHIVQFVNTGRKPKIKKIDIVATKWLNYNETKKKCTVRYPQPPYNADSSLAYNNMLSALADVPENWIVYTVIIKGRARSLSEANKKCEELNCKESVLTLESDDDIDIAERKAANQIKQANFKNISDSMKDLISGGNSSTDIDYNENLELPYKTKKRKSMNGSLQCITNTNTTHDAHTKSNFNISNKKERLKNSNSESSKASDSLQPFLMIMTEMKQLQKDVEFIKNEIHLIKVVQEKIGGVTSVDYCATITQLGEKYSLVIPFQSVIEFQEFNYNLKQDESLSKDLCTVLQTGVDPSLILSKSIVNILKMFLTKDIAMQYVAVKKKNNKFTMKNTTFFNKIEAILKQRREAAGLPTTDKEVLTALSHVLSNAVSWYKNTNIPNENVSPSRKSSPTGNSFASASNELSKVIATGTIKNGLVHLDDPNFNLSDYFRNINRPSDADDDDSDDCSNFKESNYLQHFVK